MKTWVTTLETCVPVGGYISQVTSFAVTLVFVAVDFKPATMHSALICSCGSLSYTCVYKPTHVCPTKSVTCTPAIHRALAF